MSSCGGDDDADQQGGGKSGKGGTAGTSGRSGGTSGSSTGGRGGRSNGDGGASGGDAASAGEGGDGGRGNAGPAAGSAGTLGGTEGVSGSAQGGEDAGSGTGGDGEAGTAGSGFERTIESACEAVVSRRQEAAEGTDCVIDTAAEVAGCIADATDWWSACETENLDFLECRFGLTDWTCYFDDVEHYLQSPTGCDEAYERLYECSVFDGLDPDCIAHGEHVGDVTAGLPCWNSRTVLDSAVACNATLESAAASCPSEAQTYYACLSETTGDAWTCQVNVGVTPQVDTCATERSEWEECEMAVAPTPCGAYYDRLRSVSGELGCYLPPITYLWYCSGRVADALCPNSFSDFFACVAEVPTEQWACSDGYYFEQEGCTGAGVNDCWSCEFTSDSAVDASFTIMGDDYYKLWVNGSLIDDQQWPWTESRAYPLSFERSATAPNVIAIEGINLNYYETLDRGVLAGLDVLYGPTTQHMYTDARYKAHPSFDDPNWVNTDTDESAWGPANAYLLGSEDPLAVVVPTELRPASWIWLYSPDTDNKPGDETVYFRRTFYVTRDGVLSDMPVECVPHDPW